MIATTRAVGFLPPIALALTMGCQPPAEMPVAAPTQPACGTATPSASPSIDACQRAGESSGL